MEREREKRRKGKKGGGKRNVRKRDELHVIKIRGDND